MAAGRAVALNDGALEAFKSLPQPVRMDAPIFPLKPLDPRGASTARRAGNVTDVWPHDQRNDSTLLVPGRRLVAGRGRVQFGAEQRTLVSDPAPIVAPGAVSGGDSRGFSGGC